MYAFFNRFEIEMTKETAMRCSHQGPCDADIKAVIASKKIKRPKNCTPEALVAELDEYGAWEENDLKNDAENWRKIVWLASGNIVEEIKRKLRKIIP